MLLIFAWCSDELFIIYFYDAFLISIIWLFTQHLTASCKWTPLRNAILLTHIFWALILIARALLSFRCLLIKIDGMQINPSSFAKHRISLSIKIVFIDAGNFAFGSIVMLKKSSFRLTEWFKESFIPIWWLGESINPLRWLWESMPLS